MTNSNMAGPRTSSDEQLSAMGMTVAVHARRQPDRLAIISPSGNRTWKQLNDRANQLVRLFRRRGLQPGDGVALLAHNGPEFAEVWAATQRAGFRLTAVNWHQSPEIIAYVVENCDARVLVASGRFVPGALAAVAARTILALDTPYFVKTKSTWLPAGEEGVLSELSALTGLDDPIQGFVARNEALAVVYGFPLAGPVKEVQSSLIELPIGLPVQFSRWVSRGSRSWRGSLDICLSVCVGQSGALKLIKSS